MKKKNSLFPATAVPALPRRIALGLAGGILLMLVLPGCSSGGRSVHSLLPEEKQFLSEVRYIISGKERKIFRNTPATERAQFIEEFWKTRDPDPTTEENEFRDEYYRRIDEANRLFREGSPGWLSDRGRIFILLGEPERRDVYPSGYSFYQPPVEIWFYGAFPIVFIDSQREGMYKLDPTSARRISMINVAQMQLKPKGIERNVRLFTFSLAAESLGPGRARLLLEVPYRVTNLVLNEQTRVYETRLKLAVLVRDPEGRTALEKEELRTVSVSDAMLAGLGKNITLEFPLQLPAGPYTVRVTLENTADSSQAQKEIQVKL
ncbi:MAG: GWxTD domain-containing protein [Acidobacteria bacterium]|jgi:GWxTD domain-containing protein|nr:GWxTD domain-containing protein [Acidobacteriota bacterium]